MAKINHFSNIDVVNNIVENAIVNGVAHISIDEGNILGREVQIGGRNLLNFGTCGYMALEKDPRVVQRSIEFTMKHGVQYSLSRTYATAETNETLEHKLSSIYGKNVIVFPSTTLAHVSIIPVLIESDDAVILDQQVHFSVQTATQLLRQNRTHIDMIRHSNLDMLERKVKELKDKHQRIWYMIDGVFSMFGDLAPIHDIIALMEKYEQLHVYIDDAHGMSWTGDNGGGYIHNEVKVHDRMILTSTLAKGFGCIGGIAAFPNEKWWWKVKAFGGPLSYSHPLPPPMLGAALASVDIHLSDEIYKMQNELKEKLEYCNILLSKKEIPVLSHPKTPIKFIGVGEPGTGYKIVKGIKNDGFFVNIGAFPVVPIKNTGVRFTITRHQKNEDIKNLIDCIEYNYYKTIKEQKISYNAIRRAFKLPVDKEIKPNGSLITSIEQLEKKEWDNIFGSSGTFNYEALKFLEKSFNNNEEKHNNWNFYYIVKRDKNKKIKLAAFLTSAIYKDDMLSPRGKSTQIEEKRKKEPYFFTSKTLALGSLFSMGEHLYVDKADENWEDYLLQFFNELDEIKHAENASTVLLRDFPADEELNKFFIEKGFFKVEMPQHNLVDVSGWNTEEEYIESLSARNRRHIRQDVIRHQEKFIIQYSDSLDKNEFERAYDLYLNVFRKNLAVNIFPFPQKVLKEINNDSNWEFIKLYPKEDPDKLIGLVMCYKSKTSYNPLYVGLDYDYRDIKIYKQTLYEMVTRGKKLGYDEVNLGFTAVIDKKKFGAYQKDAFAYIQTRDNFSMQLLSSMAE